MLSCKLPMVHTIMPVFLIISVGRMSTENVQLGGLDIPKGTAVIVPVMSIHQDPKIWEDPMNFRPERYNLYEAHCE